MGKVGGEGREEDYRKEGKNAKRREGGMDAEGEGNGRNPF